MEGDDVLAKEPRSPDTPQLVPIEKEMNGSDQGLKARYSMSEVVNFPPFRVFGILAVSLSIVTPLAMMFMPLFRPTMENATCRDTSCLIKKLEKNFDELNVQLRSLKERLDLFYHPVLRKRIREYETCQGTSFVIKKVEKSFDELNVHMKSLKERLDIPKKDSDGGCGGGTAGSDAIGGLPMCGLGSGTVGLGAGGTLGDGDVTVGDVTTVTGGGVLEDKAEL